MNEKIRYEFKKENRYLTRGVSKDVPLKVQIVIWSIIDNHIESDIETDYLQVFNFQEKHGRFFIHHSQEVPQYQKSYEYDLVDDLVPLVGKRIFVIDDVTHSTMLLSNEY